MALPKLSATYGRCCDCSWCVKALMRSQSLTRHTFQHLMLCWSLMLCGADRPCPGLRVFQIRVKFFTSACSGLTDACRSFADVCCTLTHSCCIFADVCCVFIDVCFVFLADVCCVFPEPTHACHLSEIERAYLFCASGYGGICWRGPRGLLLVLRPWP